MAKTKKRGKSAASGRTRAAKAARLRGTKTRKDSAGFPDRIFAVASPHSVGGVSMFTSGLTIDAANVGAFESDENLVRGAMAASSRRRLRGAVRDDANDQYRGISNDIREGRFSLSSWRSSARPSRAGASSGSRPASTFPDTPVFGLDRYVEVKFRRRPGGRRHRAAVFAADAHPFPPPARYWHLDVPADVSLGCNADRAHRAGVTGLGIRIAMVDTGRQHIRSSLIEATASSRPCSAPAPLTAHRLGWPWHR